MHSVDENPYLLRLYVMLAALSGALTALGFQRWKDMTRAEVALTLTAGFSFAIFATPWVVHDWMGVPDSNTRAIAAMTYVFGSGSNILLPTVIRGVKRLAGAGDGR